MDHTTTTTFIRIKVAKEVLNAGEQRIWLYQHVQQSIQLLPTW